MRGVMGRVLIALSILLIPTAATGQTLEDYDYEDLRFRGMGLEVGYIVPWNIEPTVSYGLRGDMGFAGPHVRIAPSIRYWSSHLREEEVERLATQFIEICSRRAPGSCPASLDLGEVRRSDLELSVDAHIVPDLPTALVPYGGGGVGLHLLNGGGEAIDGTFVEDLLDTVAPGVNLVGGVQLDLGTVVRFYTEGRLVLTSDVQYGNLVLGGLWSFPSPPAAAFEGGGTR